MAGHRRKHPSSVYKEIWDAYRVGDTEKLHAMLDIRSKDGRIIGAKWIMVFHARRYFGDLRGRCVNKGDGRGWKNLG